MSMPEKKQLIDRAAELLEADESSVIMTLDQMMADQDLFGQKIAEEEQAIYLPAFYYAETGTAGKLKRLLEAPGGGSFVEILNGCQGEDRQSGAFHRCQKD